MPEKVLKPLDTISAKMRSRLLLPGRQKELESLSE
jgi:hypothetical protein